LGGGFGCDAVVKTGGSCSSATKAVASGPHAVETAPSPKRNRFLLTLVCSANAESVWRGRSPRGSETSCPFSESPFS
jgi:hypothetical protein